MLESPSSTETVLALDPSLRCFGYAVFDCGTFLAAGAVETSPLSGTVHDSDLHALTVLSGALADIVRRFSIQRVVFEDTVGAKSSRAVASLHMAKAVAVSVPVSLGLPVSSIPAYEIRRILLGDRFSEKSEILEFVRSMVPGFETFEAENSRSVVLAASDAAAVYLALSLRSETASHAKPKTYTIRKPGKKKTG